VNVTPASARKNRAVLFSSGEENEIRERVIVDALSGLETRAPKGDRGSQRGVPEGERLTRSRVSTSRR